MKIAYLNPWENAAENQAYFSLAEAARNAGHNLVDCRTVQDVEWENPDFIISVASSIPKVVDAPTYLTLHEPTKRFLENPFYLKNLLTYDGFLTISDSLKNFIRHIQFGVGRPCHVGFYYNTPQISNIQTDFSGLTNQGQLRVVYIGTNWDNRLPDLFTALDEEDILRIHGPQASWDNRRYKSYGGPLPFDGSAPQQAYATNGLGLVLLSKDHLREDVISNRIFEISSVGALPICPSTPWIRKWFGDSVLYYDPTQSARGIARQLIELYEFCRRNPFDIQMMASRARDIFEKYFSAERLLENVISYHNYNRGARRIRIARLGKSPDVSVIVRCGGRPISIVNRAIDSIRRQTFGRFSVILSKYRDFDVKDIVADRSGNISSFTELLTEGGSRVSTLLAGCQAINTQYFAVLDDDDYWLDDHVETLFSVARVVDPEFDMVFSGTICVDDQPTQIERNLLWNHNVYTFGFRDSPASINDVTREFASNCFIARSDLLIEECFDVQEMESAEDSLLIAMLARRKRPIFSYKATAFFHRGRSDQSNFQTLASRRRDLQTLYMRTGASLKPQWLNSGSLQVLLEGGSFLATAAIENG